MRVTVHFCKSKGLGAQLLRLFLMSRWNHVAIQVGGVVYESVWGKGVIQHPAHASVHRWERVSSVDVDVADVAALLAFLNSQVGKPYDWRAILAFPFRGSWQKRDAWFCSELVYEALRVGGGKLPDRLPANRITPRDLWVALP